MARSYFVGYVQWLNKFSHVTVVVVVVVSAAAAAAAEYQVGVHQTSDS